MFRTITRLFIYTREVMVDDEMPRHVRPHLGNAVSLTSPPGCCPGWKFCYRRLACSRPIPQAPGIWKPADRRQ